MSDLIPFDIQGEIMKRVPVKSLIQFRSVSKAWKSLIDIREFITRHSQHRLTHPHRLMVLYVDHDYNYLTFLDDQTFPQHRSVPAIPPSLERLKSPRLVGSSQGLLCLYGNYSYYTYAERKAVIWNPSIRKAIVPNVTFSTKCPVIMGFGVSPVTGDPTIVEFYPDDNRRRLVRVFKLSTGNWTDYSNNLPRPEYDVTWYQTVVDKFIYWSAHIWVSKKTCNVILSFDMTNHKFGEVEFPKRLAFKAHKYFEISKVRESLGVLEYRRRKHVCHVWVMENDGAFKKLFTIREPNEEIQIVGFNKSDHPILEMGYESEDPEKAQLSVYDRSSKHINDLGINGKEDLFYVNGYMETLLLLDQPEV